MLLTEYNEARQMELFREEGRQEGIQLGIQRGCQQGQNMLAALISKLLSLGRSGDIERVVADSSYREQLFREFKIG